MRTSAVTSGTFTLSYGGYTTSDIAYNADISTVQAALDALPIQPGDITVGGTALNGSGTLTFQFANTLGDVSNILLDSSNLSDQTLAVTERTKGVAIAEVQQITHSSAVTGTFTLSYGGYTTSGLNATASITTFRPHSMRCPASNRAT